jgi:hypothetical protein
MELAMMEKTETLETKLEMKTEMQKTEKTKLSSSSHIQKIKPLVVAASTILDPGCRPTGT